ncbi:glycine cleavage system protein H [Vagococcus jeotgali]|uniref:glycine cleavage system protein H n=1 Tax=Vagococcus jeotgali TaxID=3109030 RepID=UPI002DDABCD2|nr:glycine cleavage system protein H [Vagococcus sp. B2T-5]
MSQGNLWFKTDKEVITVGLTAQAQDDLGSITFAMLPKVDQLIKLGEPVIELEAEKAVVEYESPVEGKVVRVNEEALNNPKLLDEPDAWLFSVIEVI